MYSYSPPPSYPPLSLQTERPSAIRVCRKQQWKNIDDGWIVFLHGILHHCWRWRMMDEIKLFFFFHIRDSLNVYTWALLYHNYLYIAQSQISLLWQVITSGLCSPMNLCVQEIVNLLEQMKFILISQFHQEVHYFIMKSNIGLLKAKTYKTAL